MSRHTQNSLAIVGAIAAGIFLVAFVALMVMGGFNFSPAAFLAILIAAVAAVDIEIVVDRPDVAVALQAGFVLGVGDRRFRIDVRRVVVVDVVVARAGQFRRGCLGFLRFAGFGSLSFRGVATDWDAADEQAKRGDQQRCSVPRSSACPRHGRQKSRNRFSQMVRFG